MVEYSLMGMMAEEEEGVGRSVEVSREGFTEQRREKTTDENDHSRPMDGDDFVQWPTDAKVAIEGDECDEERRVENMSGEKAVEFT